MTRFFDQRLAFLSLFFISFSFLLPRTAPHITTGDAAELSLSGVTLGVAHSPGYPVFTLVNKLLSQLIFWGNQAFEQNVFSSLLISFSLVFLGYFLFLATQHKLALFLPILFLVSPILRDQAALTEVFPLTFFWAIFFLWIIFLFQSDPALFPLLSFLMGVGFVIHQTLVLLIPAFVFFLWKSEKFTWVELKKQAPLGLLFFFLGLSLVFYLPIRSFAQPVLDWEDPETIRRFWGVITRARYGFLKLTQGAFQSFFSWERLWQTILYSRDILVQNFGWMGVALMFLGSLQSLAQKKHREFMAFTWLLIVFTGPFFFWFSGGISSQGGVEILARFSLLPLLGCFLLIAMGFLLLLVSAIPLYRIFAGLLLVLFLVETTTRTSDFFSMRNPNSGNLKVNKVGESRRWDLSHREAIQNLLRMIPLRSGLIADRADETEFGLAYFLLGENRRKDINFIDANAGVTRSIYGEDYYQIWGRPRLDRRQKIESEIIENSKDPVFYATVDPQMIDIFRSPHGFIFRAFPLHPKNDLFLFPWHRLFTWRFMPLDTRASHIYRTNLDLLGRYFFECGLKEAAEASFGLAQKAGGAQRWEMMGYWHQVRGRLFEARNFYQKSRSVGNNSEALFSNFGAMELDAGRADLALELYHQGLNLYPNSTPLLYNAAVAYWQRAQFDQVKSLLERILVLNPRHVEALALMNSLQSRMISQ